jgi:hypothetical protein
MPEAPTFPPLPPPLVEPPLVEPPLELPLWPASLPPELPFPALPELEPELPAVVPQVAVATQSSALLPQPESCKTTAPTPNESTDKAKILMLILRMNRKN